MDAASDVGERRAAVRRQLEVGDVSGLRELASRLQADGVSVTPDTLRGDVRSLGAIRVHAGDSSVLALPIDEAAGRQADGPVERLATEISADPDWPIQVGVAVVVLVFVVVGLLGWLIS